MPIYEYRCSGCGHEKEVLQKMSDAPLTECPACGKPTLKKLISAAGFQLKGSGWYATDFRGGPKPKSDESAKGEASTKGEGSTKGGETAKADEKDGTKAKTETKSDTKSDSTTPAPAAT